MKAVLCAPLEDVVGFLSPFVGDKKSRLTLVEGCAEMASEIAERSRAVEQFLGPRSVPARVALRKRLSAARRAGRRNCSQEPRKIRVRQVAARQRSRLSSSGPDICGK